MGSGADEVAERVAGVLRGAGLDPSAEARDAGLLVVVRAREPGGREVFRVEVSTLPGMVSVEAFTMAGGWARAAGGSCYAYNMARHLERAVGDVERLARRSAVALGLLPPCEAAATFDLAELAADMAAGVLPCPLAADARGVLSRPHGREDLLDLAAMVAAQPPGSAPRRLAARARRLIGLTG